MELNQLNRLFGKTDEDLVFCEQKIQNWTKFFNDYKALEERLSTLTDKTRYDVMVPVGGSNLAFMDGYVKHTNEILVLLGDNYFVERSAKQAKEIVGRRLNKCHQMIEELNKEKSHLQKWLSFSQHFAEENETKDFVEIVEQFDEEKEKKWREDHRRRVREYKLSQKSQNKESEDFEVIKKLEELEIEENKSQKHELKSILKKTVRREESTESDKSVAFDETIPSVSITNEESNQINANTTEPEPQISNIAFKNQIKERDIEPELLSESCVELKSSPKIVSRFKANRMKK